MFLEPELRQPLRAMARAGALRAIELLEEDHPEAAKQLGELA